jgi:hypothetical protein
MVFVTKSDIKSIQSDPTIELAQEKIISSIDKIEMG